MVATFSPQAHVGLAGRPLRPRPLHRRPDALGRLADEGGLRLGPGARRAAHDAEGADQLAMLDQRHADPGHEIVREQQNPTRLGYLRGRGNIRDDDRKPHLVERNEVSDERKRIGSDIGTSRAAKMLALDHQIPFRFVDRGIMRAVDVEVIAEQPAGHRLDLGGIGEGAQGVAQPEQESLLLLACAQGLLGQLVFVDVLARTVPADDAPIRIAARIGPRAQPAVAAALPHANAVLNVEHSAGADTIHPGREQGGGVVRVLHRPATPSEAVDPGPFAEAM